MKLETFFEKFGQFADAPDAVAKMRELVRHLAVTGKLVGQDPRDESGDLLLKKINAERKAAVKARQINPMKPVPEVGKDELLFGLQHGWAAARLIELVMEIQTGPFGSSLHKSDYQVGGIPVINPATLRDGKIVPIAEMAIGDATLKRLEVFKLSAGDIVMARRGEMGRCALVTRNEEGWICGTGSLVLRMPRSLYPPYFAMLIGAPMARTYLGGASVGTTMQNLNQSILAKMPVGVPPLAEQKRIVAKVDELMALCDRLEAQEQERESRARGIARASLARFADAPTPANLHFLFHPSYAIPPADLRKSILTLAVQGKLVPQDPNDEPAASLLAEITRKKQAMIEAKQVRQGKVSRPHSALDAPTELPSGWEWVNVDSLCFKVTDGTHFTPQYSSSGVRFVSAKDIVSDKLVFDRCKFITQEEHDRLYRRCNPEYHDIVISKSGSIGTVALVEDRGEFSLFESLALLKYDQASLFPAFLVCALTHACASLTTGHIRGVGVKHLHLDILRGLELALPPIAEQRRIVAKVEQLMALVDALETQLAASRTTGANLLEALVAELTARPSTPSEKIEYQPRDAFLRNFRKAVNTCGPDHTQG